MSIDETLLSLFIWFCLFLIDCLVNVFFCKIARKSFYSAHKNYINSRFVFIDIIFIAIVLELFIGLELWVVRVAFRCGLFCQRQSRCIQWFFQRTRSTHSFFIVVATFLIFLYILDSCTARLLHSVIFFIVVSMNGESLIYAW